MTLRACVPKFTLEFVLGASVPYTDHEGFLQTSWNMKPPGGNEAPVSSQTAAISRRGKRQRKHLLPPLPHLEAQVVPGIFRWPRSTQPKSRFAPAKALSSSNHGAPNEVARGQKIPRTNQKVSTGWASFQKVWNIKEIQRTYSSVMAHNKHVRCKKIWKHQAACTIIDHICILPATA